MKKIVIYKELIIMKRIFKKALIVSCIATSVMLPVTPTMAATQQKQGIVVENNKSYYYNNGKKMGEVVKGLDGWYEIHVASNTKYNVDVYGAGYNSDANIQVFQDNNTIAQRFLFKKSKQDGVYTINTGTGDHQKRLDVERGVKGENVRQWDANPYNAERFIVVKDSAGNHNIVNYATGQALTLEKAVGNGVNIKDGAYSNSTRQQFKISAVLKTDKDGKAIKDKNGKTIQIADKDLPTNPAGIKSGLYYINPTNVTGYSLALESNTRNDVPLVLKKTDTGSLAQQFYIQNLGSGLYAIKTGSSSFNKAVDAGGTLLSWGEQRVYQHEYSKTNNWQKFKIFKYSDGSYGFLNLATNKVIDVSGVESEGRPIQNYAHKLTFNGLRGIAGSEFELKGHWYTQTIVKFHSNTPGNERTYSEKYVYGAAGNKFGMNTKNGVGVDHFGSWKRAGYVFMGWSTKKVTDSYTTTTKYPGDAKVLNTWIMENKDKTVDLYAVWAKTAVTPEAFGAKGDGKTNDSGAIQKAVNYLQKLPQSATKTLTMTKNYYVPDVVYVIGKNITFNGGGTINLKNDGVANEQCFSVCGYNINFKNLTFKCNYAYKLNKNIIDNDKVAGSCIHYYTGDKCKNTNASNKCIHGNSTRKGNHVFKSTVENCKFINTGRRAINIQAEGHALPGGKYGLTNFDNARVSGITIKNNKFENNNGITVCTAGGDNIKIQSNTFNNSGLEFITLDWGTRNSLVENNTFTGQVGGCGMIGVDTGRNNTIRGNKYNAYHPEWNIWHVRMNDDTGVSANMHISDTTHVSYNK